VLPSGHRVKTPHKYRGSISAYRESRLTGMSLRGIKHLSRNRQSHCPTLQGLLGPSQIRHSQPVLPPAPFSFLRSILVQEILNKIRELETYYRYVGLSAVVLTNLERSLKLRIGTMQPFDSPI
jgi:hypothetical protein